MPELNEHGQPVGDVVAGWAPRPRVRAVSLTGRYVTLEPLAPEHHPGQVVELYDALCGPQGADLWTYRVSEVPRDPDGLAAMLRAQAAAAPELESFVLRPAGQSAAGLASYARIEPAAGQVEIAAVLLSHRLQRTTAATEAIHLLLAHALDDLGYRRVEWKCDALNEPSRRAAARLGFRAEGRFRHHLVVKGRNRDTDWFALTDAGWPAVRAAHRRWLAPDNFDAAGRQRTSLADLTGSLPG